WNGNGWKFWQWTDCVSVPGVKHCSDGDRLNGTKLASVTIDPFPSGLPLLSTPPTIVGPPEAGQLLAAVPGLWEGGKPLTFTYQWRRCDAAGATCAAISSATAETYRPVSDDVGHSLKVLVTATSAAGTASTTTAPTAAVSPAGTSPAARPTNLKPPVIGGTAQAGQILTSSVGTWAGSPTKEAPATSRPTTGARPSPGSRARCRSGRPSRSRPSAAPSQCPAAKSPSRCRGWRPRDSGGRST